MLSHIPYLSEATKHSQSPSFLLLSIKNSKQSPCLQGSSVQGASQNHPPYLSSNSHHSPPRKPSVPFVLYFR